METLSEALLSTHIIAGSISLILFWIPIFTKKGGKIHNTIGKIYVYLMWIVVLSAGVLSIENLIQGDYLMASFLGFLTLITSNPLWYAMATLKHKKGMTEGYKRTHLIFNSVLTIGGFLLILYGCTMIGQGPEVMLFFFGILGMTNGKEVYNHFKQPKTKEDWYKQHYTGMIITAIAAYTAFAVFGGNQLLSGKLPGYLMALPWILPTIIGTIIITYMGRGRGREKKKKALPTMLLIFTLLLSNWSFAQIRLEVEIENLKSDSGNIRLALLDAEKNQIRGELGQILNRKSTIVFENLKPAKYAIQYYHDENSNGKLDTYFIGLPKEGYGFSNNAYGLFGPKDFEKWIFSLTSNTKITLKTK